MKPPSISDRFFEDAAESPAEKDRAAQGWICIKDRATGRAMIAWANTRVGALWLLRAMNVADKTADRLSEDAA